LIIDEFQTFGTSIIATVLSKARKWNLELTIAHQFLEQIDKEIRDAILGNCSNLNCFAVGPDDAKIMSSKMN
jgi:type IV secretory pathway TraG/TraD family ATPase VirD4